MRVRRGGRERRTEARILYLVEWDWEDVRGGGPAFVGLDSMGVISIGEAEVEARRV